MSFKMPGLLKSPAFAVGALAEINVRYDRMAENAEQYKLAAQQRGAELFKEHKATTAKLKVENEAKVMIAGDFSPALADYLDSKGMINFIAGQAPDKFFELMDQKASEVQAAGGIPEGFTANENMYYGDQRFEDQTTSYNKVKDFMDTQNNVFGNSFFTSLTSFDISFIICVSLAKDIGSFCSIDRLTSFSPAFFASAVMDRNTGSANKTAPSTDHLPSPKPANNNVLANASTGTPVSNRDINCVNCGSLCI